MIFLVMHPLYIDELKHIDHDEFLPEALPRARAQRGWTPQDGPLPALYLSHGAPPRSTTARG